MKINNNTLAIVTGAASGMGLAVSQHLSTQGAKVVMLDINEEQVQKEANKLNGIGFACDVCDEKKIDPLFDEIKAMNGECRVSVNCAGIAPAKRIVGRNGAMALADFASVININLIVTFNVLRKAAELMMTNEPVGESDERGVIINTASVAAFEGQIGQSAYSASKGGVVGMTLPAAREFAQFGIRVNTIAPGLVATPMLLKMPQEVQDALAKSVPFPKRLAKPEEFASLVGHIIDNEMINGEVIRLDGAIRMQPR